MKPLKKTIYLFGIMPMMALLQQCTPVTPTAQEIPYDKKNAQEHVIPIDTALKLTAAFGRGQAELKKQLKDTLYLDKSFSFPLAEKFNRDAIALLLNQKGAKGIRIYLGKDSKGLVKMVLFAVDDKGNDIKGLHKKMKTSMGLGDDDDSGDGGIALENGQRCPALCSTDN